MQPFSKKEAVKRLNDIFSNNAEYINVRDGVYDAINDAINLGFTEVELSINCWEHTQQIYKELKAQKYDVTVYDWLTSYGITIKW